MNISTEDKIRMITAKIRNLCYYRLVVEELLWEERFRCQYIHQLRGLRDTIIQTLPELQNYDPRKDWLKGIVKLIPARVKSTECLTVITALRDYYYEYDYAKTN